MRRTSAPVMRTPIDERDAEEELQRDGGADDLGEVAGGDGDLGEDPEGDGGAARVGLAAGLREVAPGGDAELERRGSGGGSPSGWRA